MIEFLKMDGYGFYVWTAYAITFVFLIANIIAPLTRRRKVVRDISSRRRKNERRK